MSVTETKIELGSPLWIPKKRTTVLAAFVASVSSFCLGTVLSWTAPAFPEINKQPYLEDITLTQKNLVASFAMLGALLSAPATGYAMGAIGRKTTMLIIAIPFTMGWAMIAWAVNVPMLYVGRFVTGFCGGATTVVVPAYVSEITEDKIRGTLATVMILMLVTGIEFTFVIGKYFSYFWLTITCGCIPIIFLISMIFMPESPRYLLTKGNPQKASKALEWLRRASKKQYIESELTKIEGSIEESNGQSSNWRDLFTANVMKPLGICIGLVLFQQASGVNGVSFYTVDVFHSAGTDMDANTASIIIGACQILTVLLAPIVLVDKLGRKILLLASELTMILSLIALGSYFYIKEQNGNVAPEHLSWLPLVSLVSYIVGYNIGMGPIPWLVMSELLPNHVKGLASSTVTTLYWILSFLSAQTFKDLADLLRWSGLYWVSAGICIIGTIFILILLPETKGKSSDEIQKLFLTKRQSRKLTITAIGDNNKGIDNVVFQL